MKRMAPKRLKDWTDIECIAYLTFIAESVAHLTGRERDIIPVSDRVRKWLETQPKE